MGTASWSAAAFSVLAACGARSAGVAGAELGGGVEVAQPAPIAGEPRREDSVEAPLASGGDAGARLEFTELELARILRHSPLPPLPPDPTNRWADDPRAARLGQALFFDPRLSADGAISCATCHNPELDLSDGKAVFEGLGVGERRTPSLWNLAWSRWLFWDGRADSLWAQAVQPLENPLEMGGDRLALAHLVASDPRLRAAYGELFGPLPDLADGARFPAHARPVAGDLGHPHDVAWRGMAAADRRAVDEVLVHLTKSLAAYERKLVSTGSRFDRFVEGLREGDAEKLALFSDSERRGLGLFVGEARCRVCHVGPNFTDNEFHNLSLPTADGGLPTDSGRYAGSRLLRADPFNAAGEFSDAPDGAAAERLESLVVGSETWGEFKTPSLRNVARRGPLTHRGQFADLAAVIEFYSTLEGQSRLHGHRETVLVPLELTEEEKADLEAFLSTLTGAPPPEGLLGPPTLPDTGE
ncbi:MAG: cytochrome c peroxidase [Planctomycetota bacterium]|jgi:cytochrome c peroxidase|nr:cytochrome c peroxidase [Planctomycetota bacterium]MDP6762029.1 cytochrome c peroxidase [Planctomycetota bacterium]MDP6989333.1 cytochrome c peroxidase [Planctomycetota bacterium]